MRWKVHSVEEHIVPPPLYNRTQPLMSHSFKSNTVEPWAGFLKEPAPIREKQWNEVFDGKSVLITGAGGFIGSALARSLARLPIERLILLDTAEHGLYMLEQDLYANDSSPECVMIVGSIRNEALVQEMFARHKPQIIYHAAALKHVPLMEANPFAAAETNVLGTRDIARAAERYGAEQFILISTDKAVDPIGIMGASKRIAELIVLSNQSLTNMKALRLCNVLGSTGSVAPLFQKQINQGRPLTVTHSDARRFFLSIENAVGCLLNVASMHAGRLFMPKGVEAYRIEDLAHFIANRLGEIKSPIVYTGLRMGDKLHEKMISSQEQMCTETQGDLIVAFQTNPPPSKQLAEGLTEFESALTRRDLTSLITAIQGLIPDYSASGGNSKATGCSESSEAR